MKILVLDGNENQAVASVRSLARRGHEVWVGESRPWSKAGLSRSCAGSFRYTSPQVDPWRFVDDLLLEAQKKSGTLLLPMTEATTLVISSERERFAKAGARFVFPSHADVLRAFDKRQTTCLAQSLGIATPKSQSVSSLQEAADMASQCSFPVVLKPRASQEHRDGQVRATGRPRYASNPEEMRNALMEMQKHCSSIVVQEFVEGIGTGYFALMRHGELRAEFAHRRIRDVHPTGSGSALRESILPSPELRKAGLAMLKALNWHGVAMVEFRVRDNGVPVFLEVNGRFWHSLALACYAGVDFPALLVELAEHEDLAPQCSYKVGVRCRWLVGDFRHLVEVWQGRPTGYLGRFPGGFSTLLAELIPVPGTFHDNFTWEDPLPELGDWIHLLEQVGDHRK